jgi:hypothetical protein
MNDMNRKFPPPLAAQILKVVSVLLILTFFVDLGVLLTSPQFNNPQWQLNLMNQLIDRGVTPMIGFGLLYAGSWIESSAAGKPVAPPAQTAPWVDWRFWAFVVSSILGLLFLLLVPLQFNVTGQLSEQASEQINQQATQAEQRIEQEQSQLKAIADSGRLPDILKSGQLPPQQQAILQQMQQNPQSVQKQVQQARDQVATSKSQALDQTRREAMMSRLRGGLRSFLLAIGFVTIGWSGLRESR